MTMRIHELKTIQPFYDHIVSGVKNFEVRKNDRNFKVGDRLELFEYNSTEGFTGRFTHKIVTYILIGGQYGIEEGYCVMGIS